MKLFLAGAVSLASDNQIKKYDIYVTTNFTDKRENDKILLLLKVGEK